MSLREENSSVKWKALKKGDHIYPNIGVKSFYTFILQPSKYYTVMSDSLRSYGVYSPWYFPGQNTGVDSLSLLQGIFPTQVSHIAGRFFTSWATREAQEYWSG